MDELGVVRFELGLKPAQRDPRAESVVRSAERHLGLRVARARTRDVYRLLGDLNGAEAERVLGELIDPVLQTGALGRLDDGPFDVAVTVAFKPGVTDPVGKSALVAVSDMLGRKLPKQAAVFTSTLYLLDGVGPAEAEHIALELLANPVIQTITVQTRAELLRDPPDLTVPRVHGQGHRPVETIPLPDDDARLAALSQERVLALTVAELRAIRDYFADVTADRARAGLGPDPTDAELECLAQTWSEHCKHKLFNAIIRYEEDGRPPETISSVFRTFIRGATHAVDRALGQRDGSFLVSVFHDNAGVVRFDDTHHLVYKVETHNSPSALDPYGGAMTGIVGVNRDPFGTGLGAELRSNVWGYCFAEPAYDGEVPRGLMHPRRIREGVHRGVIDGGNQSGVPYGRGWELFDTRFLGKPLVFCGTVGLLPVTVAGQPGHEKAARPGDHIVMVGGRIGADGIHGATFSSAALDESAPVQAVQIGDPITQKCMFDFLLEARDLGLYSAITDNGAGGLSSSVGEMAEKPGGARLDLALAPLKYEGLAPWEILVSEAQERMTLAVPPEHLDALMALAARRDVEATCLGEFTSSGNFHVQYGAETVALIGMKFLHEGNPPLVLDAKHAPVVWDEPKGLPAADLSATLAALLARPNLASGESMARHYDHEVKGLTVIKPYVGARADVPAEATVFLARHGTRRGYVLSEGVNPFYSDIDAFAMAQAAVDLAIRRQLAAGAPLERIALLDNFCWPDPVASEHNPDGAHKLAQLVRACRGLYEACVGFEAPLVSGKDSMKNDSTLGGRRISVPATLLVSAIGQLPDVYDAITLDPKAPGELVYVLGTTLDECGGSEYFRHLGQQAGQSAPLGQPQPYVGNRVPRLALKASHSLYRGVALATAAGLVRSAAVPALGGLGAALARMAMAAELGLEVDLDRAGDLRALAADRALFSESLGRLVVTVAPRDQRGFESLMAGRPCVEIGRVTATGPLSIRHGGRSVVNAEVLELKAGWRGTLD
ncbi:MAG: hypothetical protein KF718_06890 [Polyangiaceae bacterium]|nr:hypothetical protein [Polyangiaceae bacterium]